jgi:HlyD family secretion protein
MDIRREGVVERKRRRRILLTAVGVVALALITIGVSRLEPAPPSVDRATVYMDVVKRGDVPRQVRGPGVLAPLEIRWITTTTEGRVERRVLLPGAQVEPDSVILVLSNPELEQITQDAILQLRVAEAQFEDLRVEMESRLLNERAGLAALESEHKQAQLQARANEELGREGLIPEITVQLSRLRADELEHRVALEKERLASIKKSVKARIASEDARLEQARAVAALRQSQLDALTVRAGIEGVLQEVPVEVGQRCAPGENLARVAQPDKLKAELRINETQAKDIQFGQYAEIDTRNGLIDGEVIRIDPSVRNGTVTVDVALKGELPRGARPDLSVEGTILLETLADVLYVQRPAYGQANSTIGLFKLAGDDVAERVQVHLGRSSVTIIEVLDGLAVGDRVILSDTSQWDDHDRIRLR